MKIDFPVEMTCRTLTKADLMKTYKPEEVQGYCEACNNYGKNHSCPAFPFEVAAFLAPFDHVTLVMTEIKSKPITEAWEELKNHTFDSKVGRLHTGSEKPSEADLKGAVSMLVFNEVKDRMSDLLLLAEKGHTGVVSSPPGSCTRCEPCTKSEDQACLHPDKLRHSLEALGFDVNGIYKTFFGQELVWSAEELPEDFKTCSALFSREALDEKAVKTVIERHLKVLSLDL